MKKTVIFIYLLICLLYHTGCKNASQKELLHADHPQQMTETVRINAFFDRSFDRMLDRHPMYQSTLGIKKNYDKWDDISDAYQQQTMVMIQSDLDSLHKNFDTTKLDEQALLSYKLYERDALDKIEANKYRFLNYPVNTQEGLHTDIPTFLINVHNIDSLWDAKAYIERLKKIKPLFDQLLVNLKKREELGVIPPRFVYPKVLNACRNVITGSPFDNSKNASPIEADFNRKVDSLKTISSGIRDSLKKEVSSALTVSLLPAYQELIHYLTALGKKATTTVGAWSWPQGKPFYEMAIRHTTTISISPEEVYQLGLKEVARIHNEIRGVMKKVGFKSDSVQEFLHYIKNSRKFFYPNTEAGRQAYLKQNVNAIENMKKHLDELFLTKPKADIVVKAVEKFRETSAGTAFYEQPSPDGKRPGRFYVNLYDMSQVPIYQVEALAYHEGIPGHHMQISIAQELKGLPKFRRFMDHTAYVEGWGLYCELLPKEIGMYQDPYQDFGRLSMELLRAARLVVDPGIHYYKWTREQAIAWFDKNTAEPPGECINAIERYITWPSQATAYKIGMNKILELRAKARQELGPKFDIREFHDVVLTSGSVTLPILEERVNSWIKKKKS